MTCGRERAGIASAHERGDAHTRSTTVTDVILPTERARRRGRGALFACFTFFILLITLMEGILLSDMLPLGQTNAGREFTQLQAREKRFSATGLRVRYECQNAQQISCGSFFLQLRKLEERRGRGPRPPARRHSGPRRRPLRRRPKPLKSLRP